MSRGTAKEPHGCQRNFTLIIVLLVVICGRRSNSCIYTTVFIIDIHIILVKYNTFTGNYTDQSKIFLWLLEIISGNSVSNYSTMPMFKIAYNIAKVILLSNLLTSKCLFVLAQATCALLCKITFLMIFKCYSCHKSNFM